MLVTHKQQQQNLHLINQLISKESKFAILGQYKTDISKIYQIGTIMIIVHHVILVALM